MATDMDYLHEHSVDDFSKCILLLLTVVFFNVN